MNICLYYDKNKEFIIDITPQDPELRSIIEELWSQPVTKKILISLSEGNTSLPKIQKKIGHSASTLHESLQRLVHANLVTSEMSYKGHKHKILTSKVLCVTKNPSHKTKLQKFFQGLWIDSEKTKKIINTIDSNREKWWSAEELSIKTKIPVDEIELLLSNFDSQTTKGLSHLLKSTPFEKKVLFHTKKSSKKHK